MRSRARCRLADDRQRRHEPERADEERPLLARQAVVGLPRPVAQDEAVLGQLVARWPGRSRAAAGRRRAGTRTAPPAASTRRARRCRSAGAGRRGRRRRARGCRRWISSASARPRRLQVGVAADGGELGRAVQRDPAHELGRHVVLRRAARLPDPLVGLAPDARRALRLGLHERPQPPRQPLAAPGVEQDRSPAPRRRRRSGAGRTRRCRCAPGARPRSRRARRAWTRSGRAARRRRT